ncbi:glycosyltransferase family 4 protein [Salinigranum halophilum]|uniref:glycosyltransferase family 4 protein n=1 Tax=Salinigranum halophilum TaxID=2565931 RepID=UPI00115C45A8|nr:glycosyltransferase family 4 protein [Salinigranum halophilum]
MNICLVNGVFPPSVNGGAENYVLRVAQALQARGHELAILTTKPYDGTRSLSLEREMYEGVPTYRFFPLNLSHRGEGTGNSLPAKAAWHQLDTLNPHARRVLKGFISDFEPDVVHTNNLMGISAGIGKVIAKSDARYVHMLHDYGLLCPKTSLMRERTLPGDEVGVCHDSPFPCRMYAKGKKHVMGPPDHVVSPSQHVIDVHLDRGFFEDIPATRIQHGVTSVIDEPPEPSAEPAVLYAGKQQRSKGLETLFEAAEALPQVTVHLCGSGPMSEDCEEVAQELDNVRYHGYVTSDRLHELRVSSHAAVVPSLWMENSPLVIYESLASGLPVIGSDMGGIPELVEHGERGLLFEAGDATALAQCVRTLVDDIETQHALSRNARQWALEHTMEDHVDELIGCYRGT